MKRGAFLAAFCSSFNVEIPSAADKPACNEIFHAAFQRSSNSHLQRTRAAFDFWLLQIYRDAQIFFTFTFQNLWSTEQDRFVQRRQLINSSYCSFMVLCVCSLLFTLPLLPTAVHCTRHFLTHPHLHRTAMILVI